MVNQGQSFLWPGLSENQEITIEDVGPDEGAGLAEGEVKLSDSISTDLSTAFSSDDVQAVGDLRDSIDPRDVHSNRPRTARVADEAKDAEITSDPLEWSSAPSQFDFPGVDTGPTFREEQGEDFDTEGFLEQL